MYGTNRAGQERARRYVGGEMPHLRHYRDDGGEAGGVGNAGAAGAGSSDAITIPAVPPPPPPPPVAAKPDDSPDGFSAIKGKTQVATGPKPLNADAVANMFKRGGTP